MHVSQVAFALPFVFLAVVSAEGITIVQNGSPKASIVIPGAASPTERFAAQEIQRYVEAMSGAGLATVTDDDIPGGALISIGRTRLAATRVESKMPSDDPYLIKTVGQTLILLGKGDRGTIYSAYHFLERYLGCRWVFPGELGDAIPLRRDIQIGEIDEFCEPAFRFRIAAGFNNTDCIDWAIKQRMQVYSPDPKAWEREEVIKRGGYVKGTMHHAFHRLFPSDQYFSGTPEYYGLIGGKRVAELNRGQLCVSEDRVHRRSPWHSRNRRSIP